MLSTSKAAVPDYQKPCRFGKHVAGRYILTAESICIPLHKFVFRRSQKKPGIDKTAAFVRGRRHVH